MNTAATTSQAENNLVINREIASLRQQYHRLNYSAARDQIRARSPELFGLPAHGQVSTARNRGQAAPVVQNRAVEDAIEVYRKANPGCTYGKAHDIVRNRQPELFGIVKNRDAAGDQTDDSIRAEVIQVEIDKLRADRPKLSYKEARDLVRRDHPAIFGLPA